MSQLTPDIIGKRPDNNRSRAFRSVIIAASLLIVVLVAALATQAATASSRKAVIQAMTLERSLNALMSSVQDAETGQRGYLLTGDEKYLAPYISSLESTPEALAQLNEFISPGSNKARFRQLDFLIREKYEELTATIGMRRAGNLDSAITLVDSDRGRNLMMAIRKEIATLEKAEREEVDAKIATVQSLFNLDLGLRIIIFVGMFVILYFLYSRLHPLVSDLEDAVEEKNDEIVIRRRAEEENVRLIADLKNKNEDLDHFAYIASHDLQEPLRTVTNFIGILEEEHADDIGEDSGTYFGFINSATEHMRTLIETLLRYSQLGRGSEPHTVALNEVINTVKLQLHARIQETGAEVIVGDLPVLEAYKIEITQVFQNLIGNSLKFVSEGKAPRIDIFQAGEGTSSFKIGVRDNGIGMSETEIAKIFQMFSRVNQAGSYLGHGIGLAFCRKIMEMHGGEISVTSTPGQGTTFFLTLPKNLTTVK